MASSRKDRGCITADKRHGLRPVCADVCRKFREMATWWSRGMPFSRFRRVRDFHFEETTFWRFIFVIATFATCYYLVVFSDAKNEDVDSAKLIGGGRPFKKQGVKRSSAGSDQNQRKRRENQKANKAADNSSNASGGYDSSDHDADESDSNAPSGLSTQDSNLSKNLGGRPTKEKRKRGPGRGQNQQRN